MYFLANRFIKFKWVDLWSIYDRFITDFDSDSELTLDRFRVRFIFLKLWSPLEFSLSRSLMILMKYEAIFLDFVIFLFDSLFLNVRIALMLLC